MRFIIFILLFSQTLLAGTIPMQESLLLQKFWKESFLKIEKIFSKKSLTPNSFFPHRQQVSLGPFWIELRGKQPSELEFIWRAKKDDLNRYFRQRGYQEVSFKDDLEVRRKLTLEQAKDYSFAPRERVNRLPASLENQQKVKILLKNVSQVLYYFPQYHREIQSFVDQSDGQMKAEVELTFQTPRIQELLALDARDFYLAFLSFCSNQKGKYKALLNREETTCLRAWTDRFDQLWIPLNEGREVDPKQVESFYRALLTQENSLFSLERLVIGPLHYQVELHGRSQSDYRLMNYAKEGKWKESPSRSLATSQPFP